MIKMFSKNINDGGQRMEDTVQYHIAAIDFFTKQLAIIGRGGERCH